MFLAFGFVLGLSLPGEDLTICLDKYNPADPYGSWECVADWINTLPRSERSSQLARVPKEIERLLEKHPEDPFLWYNHSSWLEDPGQWRNPLEKALALAIDQKDEDMEFWIRASFLHYAFREGNADALKGHINEMRSRYPNRKDRDANTVKAYISFDNLWVRYLLDYEGDFDEAERVLALMETYALGNPLWHFRSGHFATRLGEYDVASRHWMAYTDYYKGRVNERTGLAHLLASELFVLPPTPKNQGDVLERAQKICNFKNTRGKSLIARYVMARHTRTLDSVPLALEGLAEAKKWKEPEWEASFLTLLAAREAAENPEKSRAYSAQAAALMETLDFQWGETISALPYMQTLWTLATPQEALAGGLRLLDIMERAGKRSMDDQNRVKVLATWKDIYYVLAGKLLEEQNYAVAFDVMERMRARVLTEHLTQSKAPLVFSPEVEEKLRDLDNQIAQRQKKQLNLGLDEQERARIDKELAKLELEQKTFKKEKWEAMGGQDLARPEFLPLSETQAHLEADEAMIAFQLAYESNIYGEPAGGAWVWLITADQVKVRPLPSLLKLEDGLNAYIGLFAGDSEQRSVSNMAVHLYRHLLKAVLEDIDPKIERLLLLPDGVLHHFPFATLCESADAPLLAERFRLSVIPSATLWLRWRQQDVPQNLQTLVFADPSLPTAQPVQSVAMRNASPTAPTLGPLPFAREEGRRVVSHLGKYGQLVIGEQANEVFLKNQDLSNVGVLHFAAHALVNQRRPQRSAVLLSPGEAADGQEEDGWLQPREIATLDLAGKTVVLSTCQSASGPTMGGEGVMSLARSFIRSNAHSVVGTLWPLADNQAAIFFDLFYANLAKGTSTGEALQQAQKTMIKQGAPPNAWAGVVLMGDGRHVPFPHSPRSSSKFYLLSVGFFALLAVSIFVKRRS